MSKWTTIEEQATGARGRSIGRGDMMIDKQAIITNDSEALTRALYLALSAPDDARSQQAVAVAERLAARLTAKQITRCKQKALQQWQKLNA